MVYAYSDLVARAQDWAEQAMAGQRLEKQQAEAIFAVDSRTPDNLFADIETRPLIVAFMGGTGVGKSSLLNRLAGQDIARTGVERPTSREVTLYHHDSIAIRQLPAGLPLDKITVSRHQDDSKKNIIWIDMPDFDSVELANKQLVLEWLPHIDVLLYVVSPERYRDNKAWQLLLAEGARHAWLFVLNQWDRGQSAQYEDFKKQLAKAGFEDPLVFRTICSEPADDEFDGLLRQLGVLSSGHTVQELEQRGREVRIQHLQQTLQGFTRLFDSQGQQLHDFYRQQWQSTQTLLADGFNWPLRQLAQAYAERGGSRPDISLWDDWAQSRFNDLLDDIILKASQLDMPVRPLKQALTTLRDEAGKTLSTQTELACRQALIRPGNLFQRFFIKLMRVCEFVLPLSAMSLVGYKVVTGYYQSALSGDDPYLGANFAIHSVLLIALSWLAPYFLHKKMQPSLEKAAIRGLNKGLEAAFAQINLQIKKVLENEREQNQRLQQQLQVLIGSCQQALDNKQSPKHDSQLDRMLID